MTDHDLHVDPLSALEAFVDPPDAELELAECRLAMMRRITILSEHAWEGRVNEALVERWLQNFDGKSGFAPELERLHALYLLSQLLFFGEREIRVLLRALHRDLCVVPMIARIRQANSGTRDGQLIQSHLSQQMSLTRFFGLGSPSESGGMLLYTYRQENNLHKSHFPELSFSLTQASGNDTDRDIQRYIFLDDLCGSGESAVKFSKMHLERLRDQAPHATISYHCLFATSDGLDEVRRNSVFGENAKAIFELDRSYKSISTGSRYFKIRPKSIEENVLSAIALCYGELVAPGDGRGFGKGELLLAFSHNTPDNTLPIIWREPKNGSPIPWTPAFTRHMKS